MRKRGLVAALASVAMLALGQVSIGSAQGATTTTVAPATPAQSNTFPFGVGTGAWTPNVLFFYKNVPAFNLKAGDILAFDLQAMNNVDVQLAIALASTTVNGGDVPAAPFTQIVLNSHVPANPRGNAIFGDYELQFTTQGAFNFPGGGLIIRFSNTAGAFATDNINNTVFMNSLANAADPSGFFVKRVSSEPDGAYPWAGGTETNYMPGFRLTIADLPVQPPAAAPLTPAKKKCKKKRRGKKGVAAKKKCKKKRKR